MASNASVRAAGPGDGIKGALISWMRPCRMAGSACQPGRAAMGAGKPLIGQQDPVLCDPLPGWFGEYVPAFDDAMLPTQKVKRCNGFLGRADDAFSTSHRFARSASRQRSQSAAAAVTACRTAAPTASPTAVCRPA